MEPRSRAVQRALADERVDDVDGSVSTDTRGDEHSLVEQEQLTNFIKEKTVFHYHRAVLSFQPRLQAAALMLFTSFTSPECSDHQRASLFCQRLDEFLLAPPELWRGVSSLHVPGHWADSGFLFRGIGLLEVQGINSISSTGSTCAGLERFQKCL